MKRLEIGGKVFNFEEAEHIVVEFTDKGANLNFEHLFEKGIRGKYKIILEKINDETT